MVKGLSLSLRKPPNANLRVGNRPGKKVKQQLLPETLPGLLASDLQGKLNEKNASTGKDVLHAKNICYALGKIKPTLIISCFGPIWGE